MTKLKKIFSVVLCLAIIFTLPGFAVAQSGSTEQTEDSVARVGDRYYDTLKDAVNAIDSVGTIELVADAELSGTINIAANKNITLDLGNYTITYDFSGEINNQGTLTIKAGEEGTIDARQSTNAIKNSGGQLTIISGKILGRMYAINTTNGGIVDISGGELSNTLEKGNVIYAYNSETEIAGNAKITGANIAVKIMGGDLTVSENAYITGKFGVTLFNGTEDNSQDTTHAHFNMTGGTVEATYGFALSGNNLSSALCSADITGGTLKSIDEGTGIYWPMEGDLTVGGNAVVSGGTGIEAKMGTITIKDNATVTGTGAYFDGKPEGGGSQAEGSAILASAQMYGNSEGQYITSPGLTVNITGGTLTGTKGNAVTVYNAEDTDAQTAEVNVTGGQLNAADDRAGVQVVMAKGDNETSLVQGEENNAFVTSKSNTKVTVSSDAALAAVDNNGQTSYYTSVSDALSANAAAQNPVKIYVLGDSQVDSEAISSQNITLITAKGVELAVKSDVDGMIVKETTNEDGSKTYELVDADEFAAPEVSLGADKTTVHAGEAITLTADASHSEKGVVYSYAWYKDGKLIEGQDSAVLKVTESGVYSVQVTAQKVEGNVVTTSETVESNSIKCTVEPHKYAGEWQNDPTSHWQLCACGEKGNIGEHQFGEWVVTKEASATEQGSRERVCSVCGYTQTEAIAATGEEMPKTGDDNSMLLWIAVMMLAATGAAGCTVYNRKKNN